MAVYTDVAAEDAGRASSPATTSASCCPTRASPRASRTRTSCVHTGARLLHPDALREARRGGRPAVLPGADGASAARGITCPQPVKDRNGDTLGTLCGRPAAIVTFLDGMWIRRPDAAHCAAVGEALARLHLAGADFAGQARQRALGRRLAAAVRAGGRARRRACSPACAHAIATELDASGEGLAARPAAGRDPRRPVSRQRVLSRRQAVRA